MVWLHVHDTARKRIGDPDVNLIANAAADGDRPLRRPQTARAAGLRGCRSSHPPPGTP
jgi:hypothetical protein